MLDVYIFLLLYLDSLKVETVILVPFLLAIRELP